MENKAVEIKKCLETVIQQENCVLTFDKSLIEQLPDILRENFGITRVSEIDQLPVLDRLFTLLQPGAKEKWDIALLPSLIETSGIDKRDYTPRAPATLMQENERTFAHWSLRTAKENIEEVLTLQRDLGKGQYNLSSEPHTSRWERGNSVLRDYMRGVTTLQPGVLERILRRSYWELWISWWKWRGLLDTRTPSLSVGPRWITEVEFFRRILGLEGHVGLDLHSENQDLVKVGDMHSMPFPNQHFQLIFIKNTVDKSYDVRRLVSELLRVTRPYGIIVVDQICGYGGCSPLGRTDIQKSDNLLRLFRAHCPVKVLVQRDIALSKGHRERVRDHAGNNVRLAIQLPK